MKKFFIAALSRISHSFLQASPDATEIEREYGELGSRRMDCVGRMVMRPTERERRSQQDWMWVARVLKCSDDKRQLIHDNPPRIAARS